MKRVIAGFLLTATTVTGCGAQSANRSDAPVTTTALPTPMESGPEMEFAPSDTAQAVAAEVIGMSEAKAIETIESNEGEVLIARVLRRDDESFIATMDYRLDRINLEIDDGIVTTANIG
jgi:hypothetical protein